MRENIGRIQQTLPQITKSKAKGALICCEGSLGEAIKLLLSQRDQGKNFDMSNDRTPSTRQAKGKTPEEVVINLTSDGSRSPPLEKGKALGEVIDLTSDGSPSPPPTKGKGSEQVIDATSEESSSPPPAKGNDHTNTESNTPTMQIQPKPKTYVVSENGMHVLLSASETYCSAANTAALDWVKEQDAQLRRIMKRKSSPRDQVEIILYKCVERLEEEAKKLLREEMRRFVGGITKVVEVKI
jgi:hypothetical protein